ncbi:two-component system, LytT family, sensor kinase [Actinacidiphila yanglinensis]|uniref:histidine kinase n=1 Tax=Actinacidiphila yanglinensis TaxID=310779 RepID=A0A1H5YNP6_9ACTN|nr:two-component system, LytT family, sensor kinase [Actinacidiphila yanglinensis]
MRTMGSVITVVSVALVIAGVAVALFWLVRGRRGFGTPAHRAAFATLHQASLAAPPLRDGLNADSAKRAARHLRELLGTPALAVVGEETLLAWEGPGRKHAAQAVAHAKDAMDAGRPWVVPAEAIACEDLDCPVRSAVVVPLVVDGLVVGALSVYARQVSAGLVRAAGEVAHWMISQLELAELDRSRTRVIEAELRALRAQISPHFVYNSLTAIASFVRTDPDQARELLLEFAELTRYSLRRHGEFSTLAEELHSVDRYLRLERARFGARLRVDLLIAPEVLPVAVPFLCLQPLVENAVRHGLGPKASSGRITIRAEDAGAECRISVEDDGVGMDPEQVRAQLAGKAGGDSLGLGNVDERLRAVFGDEYGLVVETAQGAGTKINVRVPKYRNGVHAS